LDIANLLQQYARNYIHKKYIAYTFTDYYSQKALKNTAFKKVYAQEISKKNIALNQQLENQRYKIQNFRYLYDYNRQIASYTQERLLNT